MVIYQLAEPVSSLTVDQLRPLYERGLYLQTWRLGEAWGQPEAWPGPAGRIMGARLVSQLGGPRRTDWLIRCAHRRWPTDGEARYFYGYGLLGRRGPYATRRWMEAGGELAAGTSPEVLSSWCALQGQIAVALRDFDQAEACLRRAEALMSERAWVLVCWSGLLMAEDRYAEALNMAQQALAVHPLYRPAVQSAAHLLTLLNRDDEALTLLATAADKLESGAVAAQLFALHLELRQFAEAGRALDRVEELSPLADTGFQQWIAAQRSEVAYHLGDIDAAIRLAQQSDSEYHKTIAERLQQPQRSSGRSVLLPVAFVRQHQVTCAPATLAAISHYWRQPADHLQVADEICYSGTHHYSQRKWAADNGWVAREFSITEESAIALLDRGIPFTFTTVEPADSHLQAIIGYDSRRGTLHVRDPFWRNVGEGLADKVLERYRAHGPRGMAMAPAAQAAQLDGLQLPDAELWDLLHQFDGALQAHRRDDATLALDKMHRQAPEHRLTLEARRCLACYDGNLREQLAVVDLLLQQFPDEQFFQLERLSALRHYVTREERLAIYERMCARKESHPIFWQQYAQELRVDACRHDDAIWLLHRAIRRWPSQASNYFILANLLWERREFDEALELYRLAVCLNDKDEQLASTYFSAANLRKRTDEALDLLRKRFARYGRKSSFPARTLASAYLQLERNREAIEVVEQALALRPDDGDLLLYAAQVYHESSLENIPHASTLIERAKDRVSRLDYARAAARVALYDGRLPDALALWQHVLALQPMLIEAHMRVAQLLAETQSRTAALEHLRQATEQFPHYYPLHELRMEWLRDEAFEVREPAISKLLAVNPDNAWAHRERAFWLADERRLEEAWKEADIAGQLEPTNPSYFLLRAKLRQAEGRIDDAMHEVRQAIELSVDNDFAISQLVGLCPTLRQRREALRFVKDQLIAQVIAGDGILSFRTYAEDTLEPDELLQVLRDALAARPELWQAWSALLQQLLQTQQLDEAVQIAQQATERFPLMPRLWLDRAQICHARLDHAGELAAIESAYRINPAWSVVVRSLAAVHQREGRFEEARRVLEHGIARNPLDAVLRIALGEILWTLGQRQAALEKAERAVQLEPGYERAWNALDYWAAELGQPQRGLDSARELTRRRPGEARSWMILARLLDAPDQAEERLAALTQAQQLNPRNVDVYDQQAVALARLARYDEARAACQPAVFGGTWPALLRARAAWIEAQRGDLETAIAQMQEVVADESQFYGGWSMLADWRRDLGRREDYLAAAAALVRIDPQASMSWGYLGDAQMLNEQSAAAAESFRRAFELDPQYEFAGNYVFDHQLDAGDLDAAGQTLRRLRLHSESAFVLSRAVQFAMKKHDQCEALSLLRKVCVLPAESDWPVRRSFEAIAEIPGAAGQAAQVLRELLALPEAHSAVGSQWVAATLDNSPAAAARKLEECRGATPAAEQATHDFLSRLAKSNRPLILRRFIDDNRDWLRAADRLWGSTGFALVTIRDWQRCADWMADWQRRKDARPWMLVNIAESLRSLGRDAEAAQCSRHALALPPDGGTRLHHLLLMADAACAGDLSVAEQHLPEVWDPESLDLDYKFLMELARAILDVGRAGESQKRAAFFRARKQINSARKQYAVYLPQEPNRRRFLAAAMKQVARQSHRWWTWLWHYGARFSRVLTIAP